MTNFFDNIGRTITSLAAVIFVMLMTITGMVLFSHTLFTNVFPEGMQPWEKLSATWFMALGWEFTVLITTCNVRHINKHIPVIMAICSGVIVLFFIQAFDNTQTALTIVQRWFVGLLAATINYIYAELFYKKWKERNDFIELPNQLIELQSQLHQLQSDNHELQRTVHERDSALLELKPKLDELTRFKHKIDRELTCPHCKEAQDSYGTLNAHKGHCTENPKNK
jgi:hypothetical protein